DKIEILDILEDVLKEEGYNVFTAIDAYVAIDILKNEKIDLLLTDIKMPGKNGIQLIEEARKLLKYKNLPVIILTGVKSRETVLKRKELNVDVYLVKPYSMSELVLIIKKLIKKKRKNIEKTDKRKNKKILKDFRVLVVDDEEDIRDILEEYLREFTSRIYTSSSVEEAIKFLKMNEIDLLITDLAMPEKDGFSLIEWMQNQEKHTGTPIIIVTGVKRDRETISHSIELGIDRFLVKPVFLEKLSESVVDIINPEYLKKKYQNMIAGYDKMLEKIQKKEKNQLSELRLKIENLDNKNYEYKKEYTAISLKTSKRDNKTESLKTLEEKIKLCEKKLEALSDELKNTRKLYSVQKRKIKNLQKAVRKKLDELKLSA
ncbi:hypothetical protein DRQ09_08470, partial [candidate division KSB1 bacterium]